MTNLELDTALVSSSFWHWLRSLFSVGGGRDTSEANLGQVSVGGAWRRLPTGTPWVLRHDGGRRRARAGPPPQPCPVPSFVEVTTSRVTHRFELPRPLLALLEWVEGHGLVTTGGDSELSSPCHPTGPGGRALSCCCAEQAATMATTARAGSDRSTNPCQTCGRSAGPRGRVDGSGVVGARRSTRIVHLGSGSGSKLTCVLGAKPVDFPRLLAIDYEKFCKTGDWTPTAQVAPTSLTGTGTVEGRRCSFATRGAVVPPPV